MVHLKQNNSATFIFTSLFILGLDPLLKQSKSLGWLGNITYFLEAKMDAT